MIALGIVFLCVLAALAVVVLSEQMLFFPRFFAYLALYAVSYPLYLANDARWYWFTLATDVSLLLATNEAINLRLRVLEDQEGRAKAVRRAAWWFGVVCCSFVALIGVTQFNLPWGFQMALELTLAFCIGRLFVVAVYVLLEQIPCPQHSARHLVFLLLFLVPSLAQMMVRIDSDKQYELYWTTRAIQMSLRIGVMLAWLSMFWPKSSAARRALRDHQSGA